MLVVHLYIFFGEMSIQVFCPFFSWVVGVFAVELYNLCILEIMPLSVASFETIFSTNSFFFHSFLCCAKACEIDYVPLFFVVVVVVVFVFWGFFLVLFLLLCETDLRKHL